MKKIGLALLTIVSFASCDPCNMYKNEIYSDELIEGVTKEEFSKWVSDLMEEWEEPNIKMFEKEAYRLSIRSGFRTDTSYIIRIENIDSGYYLTTKKIVAIDSTEVRKIVENKKRKLSKEEWTMVLENFSNSQYWTLPIILSRDSGISDAKVWIVEGRRPHAEICNKRGYHSLARVEREDSDISLLYSAMVKLGEIVVNYH